MRGRRTVRERDRGSDEVHHSALQKSVAYTIFQKVAHVLPHVSTGLAAVSPHPASHQKSSAISGSETVLKRKSKKAGAGRSPPEQDEAAAKEILGCSPRALRPSRSSHALHRLVSLLQIRAHHFGLPAEICTNLGVLFVNACVISSRFVAAHECQQISCISG